MRKTSLSVCLIVRNEEHNIDACLQSVAAIADEIILVDTGSSDATVAKAKKFPKCKVFDFPWTNDFSEARNFALSKASCDLILSIDADERLTNPAMLANVLDDHRADAGGYLIQLVSHTKNKLGGNDTYTNKLLRLFINRADIRFQGVVHEQIIYSVNVSGLKIYNTEIEIAHLGYDIFPESLANKHMRNLELLNIALNNKPDDIYNLVQRAKTYQALEKYTIAEDDFQRAINMSAPLDPMKTRALNFGAINALKMGHRAMAISRATQSLQIIPNQSFANFILGEIAYEDKDFGSALEFYTNMRNSQTNEDLAARVAGDFSIPQEQLLYKIGRCHLFMDNFEKSAEAFAKGYKLAPDQFVCLVGLANVAFKMHNYTSARNFLKNAKQLAPNNPEIDGFMAQLDLAEHGMTAANQGMQTPGDDKPRLSISMIVKNEQEYLPGCLESVKDIADEIVIVDTGSTDSTVQIAQRFGAKVYRYKWSDDFAAARNESLKYCTGDWVLYLDADERLAPESVQHLLSYISQAEAEVGALICLIESPHSLINGGSEMHRGGYPRLFRNYGYPNISFRGRVHEQITPSLIDLKKSIAISDIKIIHLGYNQSREVMEQKIKRNYSMLLAHVNEEPLNGYAWFQLGQTLGQMNLKKEAEDAIRFAIDCGDLADSIMASAAATLSQFCGDRRDFAEALTWAEKSLEKAPNQVYGNVLKAYALHFLGRSNEALDYFAKAKDIKAKKANMPMSGFDIDLSDDMIDKGIKMAMGN